MNNFEKVKNYLMELEYDIMSEDESEEILVINDESKGIKNLVIDCEAPILIIEQFIATVGNPSTEILVRLLQMNRSLVHGAFVLDETGQKVIFRDTLQIANLDKNELEGSLQALELGMVEYGQELISFVTNN